MTSTPFERKKSSLPPKFLFSPIDHARNAKLEDRACAHHAGAKGGVKRGVAVRFLSARFAQCIHFAVGNWVALLHALIAALGHDFAAACQDRADGQPPSSKPALASSNAMRSKACVIGVHVLCPIALRMVRRNRVAFPQ